VRERRGKTKHFNLVTPLTISDAAAFSEADPFTISDVLTLDLTLL
jgi:hypothetical protein